MSTTAVELTRLVRIVYDDGSEVETEMTPALAATLRRMDEAEKRREARHRKKQKTLTDRKIPANKLPPDANAKRIDQRVKPGRWEGPRINFQLLYGEGRVWNGPDCHLDSRGRCRWCPEKLSESGVCLGCHRAGQG